MNTSYIKELLYSFNQPMVKVWTPETKLYEGRTYIKDNQIVKYENGSFKYLSDYYANCEIINLTKKFNINSSVYDDYTHQCLGDFLRYTRDYYNINLMGLYNCFNNQQPFRLDYSSKDIRFNTDDNLNNYYIVPIKFDETYTIAISSGVSYEIMCCLYDNAFLESTPTKLIEESYKRINSSNFTSPFTYSTEFDCVDKVWNREKSLVMVLKLPKSVNSSIVILEGNFKNSIGTFIYDEENLPETYPSKLSLLRADTKSQKQYAPRLLEFLYGHAITNQSNILNNIERVQSKLYKDGISGYYGIWSKELHESIYKLAKDLNKYDMTFYVDKDIESLLEGE